MLSQYSGEFAALGTAFMFSIGSIMFTFAGRRIGAPLLNRTRLAVALLFIVILHQLLIGAPFPQDASPSRWFWLGLSGFVGLVLGDASLFQAFVMIGPRISMLIMALAPVLGTMMAWSFLGETITLREGMGIALTVSGIIFVIAERRSRKASEDAHITNRTYLLGLLFAFGGAAGQATGLISAKLGLSGDFPAISALAIRMASACVSIWVYTLLSRQVRNSYRTLRGEPRALGMVGLASLCGPTIGVWLSLIAIQNAPVGIASTLMALTPIFLIPVSFVAFRERTTIPAIIGTLIAFAGTALLFI